MELNESIHEDWEVKLSGRVKGPIITYRTASGLRTLFTLIADSGEFSVVYDGLALIREGEEVLVSGFRGASDFAIVCCEMADPRGRRLDIANL
ncbi:MAG: hypothetical protein QXW19_01420 [Candidatus Bathyarchaeia archaeon]